MAAHIEKARLSSEGIPEFGTPRENEERRDGGCGIVIDPATQLYAVYKRPNCVLGFFAGGVSEDEDLKEGILREVREESGLHDFGDVEYVGEAFAHYRNTLKNVNRVACATCYLIKLNSAETMDHAREAHEDFELAWATPVEMLENWRDVRKFDGCGHWVYFLHKAVARAQELGWDTVTDLDALKEIADVVI